MADRLMLPPPQAIDIHDSKVSENWRKWKDAWSLYALATGLMEKDEKVQVATLLTVIGQDARDIFHANKWENDRDRHKVQPVLRIFDQAWCPKENVPPQEKRKVETKHQQIEKTLTPEDPVRTTVADEEEELTPAIAMATFEFAGSSAKDGTVKVQKFPLRRVENTIEKFIKAIQIDLDRLTRHRLNIQKFELVHDWQSLNKENINADRTVKQLNSNVRQLRRTRMQVDDLDLAKFDAKIASVQQKAVDELQEFLSSAPAEDGGPLAELTTTSLPAIVDGDEDHEPLIGRGASGEIGQPEMTQSFMMSHPLEDAGPFPPHPQQQQQQVALQWDHVPDTQAQRSLHELKESLQELNFLMTDYSTHVHEQQEVVNRIEDNVETAQANVEQGTFSLASAAKLKTMVFPVAGALLGGVMGSPVGLVAGIKLGSLAAVGGGIAGLTGGHFLKKHQDKAVECEVSRMNAKKSVSLPDLPQEPRDEEEEGPATVPDGSGKAPGTSAGPSETTQTSEESAKPPNAVEGADQSSSDAAPKAVESQGWVGATFKSWFE